MGLSALIDGVIAYELTGPADLGEAANRYSGWGATRIESGTGSQQADRVYAKTITLAASATQSLDLSGALTDPIGGSAVFAKIKAIAVRASAGNTNGVIVGNVTNGFVGPFGAATHQVTIPPGGCFLVSAPDAGWSVVAGTGDLLRVANAGAGTSVTLDIIVIGTSA